MVWYGMVYGQTWSGETAHDAVLPEALALTLLPSLHGAVVALPRFVGLPSEVYVEYGLEIKASAAPSLSRVAAAPSVTRQLFP